MSNVHKIAKDLHERTQQDEGPPGKARMAKKQSMKRGTDLKIKDDTFKSDLTDAMWNGLDEKMKELLPEDAAEVFHDIFDMDGHVHKALQKELDYVLRVLRKDKAVM